MTLKKALLLLAFSLCLNAGFLITALVGHRTADEALQPPPFRAHARHMELLEGLDLPEETLAQAKSLLNSFMEERSALIVRKLDDRLETLALLAKNPELSKAELEAYHRDEARIEAAISALDIEYTLSMREILPPDKMRQLYLNSGELIRSHRDQIAHWKDRAD